jgi:membrane protein YdbS with pleckstrin-like domain
LSDAGPIQPSAGDSEQALDPRSVQVSRIAGAITTAIVSAIGLVTLVIVVVAARPTTGTLPLLVALWVLGSLALALLCLWWPGVRYRHIRYAVTAEGIRIRRGVLWRSVTSVPRSRVQHTDVSQGPIERMFDLATLVIFTAGTQHASIALGGLAHEAALRVRDQLIGAGADDAV